ncbi:MAG: cellulose biosynthesis cyclic di-GMP-binding regulatory protein BcsB [Roseiflexus sp.]
MCVRVVLYRLFYWAIVIVLIGGSVGAVYAQMPDPPQSDEQNAVTFERLGATDQTLSGVFDGTRYLFNIPANWQPASGAQVHLDLSVFFPVGSAQQRLGGFLEARFNRALIGTIELTQPGERRVILDIPDQALTPVRSDGRHEFEVALDNPTGCDVAPSDRTAVVIRSTSRFILPHTLTPLDTDLRNLPRPIFQGSFDPDQATIVIPDNPSINDLEAALTVAAGFGRLTEGRLQIDLTTVQRLSPQVRTGRHLILVGSHTGLAPLARNLDLPATLQENGFAAPGATLEDGILQMVISPWNSERVVLVVSGASESGVAKAARALSAVPVRINNRPNVAVVRDLPEAPTDLALAIDQRLSDLGLEPRVIRDRTGTFDLRFTLPPGQQIDEGAYFDLTFNHAATVDFGQSSLSVGLNGIPIGGVRFSDETTRVTTSRITIPPSAARSGANVLTIQTNLVPRSLCADVRSADLWATIWPESALHLPMKPATAEPRRTFNLSSYPLPFTLNPSLATTAFVVPQRDPVAWNAAALLAFHVGRQTRDAMLQPLAVFADNVPTSVRESHHLLVIGRPSALPILLELGDVLPAPFDAGSDVPRSFDTPVVYRVPPDASVAYLQMVAAPWNPERVVVAALGSDDAGIEQATIMLIDPRQRARLTGTLAIVDPQQRVTLGNGRAVLTGPASTPTTGTATPVAVQPAQPTPQTVQPTPNPAGNASSNNSWLVPVVIIVAVIGASALILWRAPWRRPPGA